MDDKTLMENLLYAVKSTCDLYFHGTIESSSGDVHGAFNCALDKTLKIQNDIYNKMSEKGWYQNKPAPQPQIQQTAQKFSLQ
mgnify:CR=1 FL=1